MSSILKKIFQRQKQTPASVAKERLQIIISHERGQKEENPSYLLDLQREIVDVIAKYVKIDKDQVNVQLEHRGENAVLELNVTMPEEVLPA